MSNHEHTISAVDFKDYFSVFHYLMKKIKETNLKDKKAYLMLDLELKMIEEDIAEMIEKKQKFNDAKLKRSLEETIGKFIVSFKNEIRDIPESQLKYLENLLGKGLIVLDEMKIKQTSGWKGFFKGLVNKVLSPIKALLQIKKTKKADPKLKQEKEVFFYASQNAKKTTKVTSLENEINLLKEQLEVLGSPALRNKILGKLGELFNVHPKKAIDILTQGATADAAISKTAHFLRLPGLDQNKIGEFLGELGTHKTKSLAKIERRTLQAYANTFDFKGKEFTKALREFLSAFHLPGEAQKIDRIIDAFAKRYYFDNQHASKFEFKNADAVSVLAFSVIMLNTDAHNANISRSKKMSLQEFIKNNRGINHGNNFSEEMLTKIYMEITTHEIKFKADTISKKPSSF